MRTYVIILFVTIAVQVIRCQAQSHYGTEFYFGLPQNHERECNVILLDIASISTGLYNLTVPFLNKVETGIILKKNLTTIKLPCNIARSGIFTDDRGIYLKTDVQVAVYVTNFGKDTAESFLALPARQLGTQFNTAAYAPFNSDAESFITIVGIRPSTHVSIYDNSKRRVKQNSTINELQVSQFVSHGDLKDISVLSDKPVSVISGTSCTTIPHGVTACDMIVEQMLPIESLANIYIAPPTPPKEAYELRIVNLASSDNKITCVYNETRKFCKNDSTISTRMGEEPAVIVSPHPVSVFQYGFGNSYPKSGVGDPFMILVPGLEHFLNKYYFAIPYVYRNAQNSISIIIKTSSVQGLFLDGNIITPNTAKTFNVPKPLQDYKVLILDVTSGFHLLRHRDISVKFGLLIYGVGALSDVFVGYGYPGGMQLSTFETYSTQSEILPETSSSPYSTPESGVHVIRCQENTDSRGTLWSASLPGRRRTIFCPNGFSGVITRECMSDGRWSAPYYNCIRKAVEAIRVLVKGIASTASPALVKNTLEQISAMASEKTKNNTLLTDKGHLTDGELKVLVVSLDELALALSDSPEVMDDSITDTYLESISNLIDDSHHEGWNSLAQSEETGAVNVMTTMQSFGDALSAFLRTSDDLKKTVVKPNLAIEVSKFSEHDVIFPSSNTTHTDSDWAVSSKSNIHLDAATIPNSAVQYITTAVMYRNLSVLIPSRTNQVTKMNESSQGNEIINGPILSLSVSPTLKDMLDPPVYITYEHRNVDYTEPSCRFWLYQSGSSGYWSDQGCSVHSTNETLTVCQCNHLTNFAVLMSPFEEADVESIGLRIVSIVGIVVSLACLLATLFVHILLWKYLKGSRTVLLANLCVALVLSYVLFLAGVDRTENKAVCTAIAACLHYIYLVVFCAMLAEGVEMAIKVIYVFETKVARVKWMVLLSWLLPAVIVGISLGVTKTEGFGHERVCWLSRDKGLVWAFVGPSLAVIIFNAVCLGIVLRVILQSRTVETKTATEKVKTSLRSLGVLLPVTGVSWILGIFYINESFSIVQYIFAICNGSQGVFIFLFNCLLNPQVKNSFSLRRRRKYDISSKGKFISNTTSKTDSSTYDRDTQPGYSRVSTGDKTDIEMS